MKRYGDFITSEEDLALLTSIRKYIDKEVMTVRMQMDDDYAVFEKAYEGLVKLGIQKRGFSPEYGGLGIRSATTICAITEEISRGDSGLSLHALIIPWCLAAAMGARNKVLMDKFIPMFCEDTPRCGCLAITEPAGGCNIEDAAEHGLTIRTKARLEGDEWVIRGEKMWPSGAGVADLYCVVCTTDAGRKEEGMALIYVPKDTPGLSFGKPEEKMGMKVTDFNAAIYFDDVRVPKEYRAGGPGIDWRLFRNNVAWGRLMSAPMTLGNAQAVLDIVIEHTRTRYYGGKPVRNHSLQAAMIADMAIGIESARAFYLSVAAMFNNRKKYGNPGEDYLMARTSAAKVYACDITEMVCNRAMELMGSYGYARDYHVEKYLRDSKIIQLWLGGGQLGRLDVVQSYYPYVESYK
ncbi:MAG: acyl-CoA dehydrogenase family protein [Proteobacteria bacterium]|nr:acyl-CoA dehydrogenase family protein [Pseudomonadota bacterium]MBU4581807.1 acyl-CoA dehydrogenase family protein [Pseudomonadota bacterium]MCG2739289.1 acyl-CoA dehydrogenase family protein [Syntrophaceae bacterium]